jgi:transcriptional regulator with XRE-family HTH domain
MRKKRGLTQEDLGQQLGVNRHTLSRVETHPAAVVPAGGFLHIPSKRYISAQTARVELMGTRDNSWTIASKSMISGDFLNS